MGDFNQQLAGYFAGQVPTDDEWTSIVDMIDALTSSMVPYTPSWTGSSGNPSIGNGTIAGAYSRAGKLGLAYFGVLFGSTTTAGTGSWSFGLPSGWTASAFALTRIAGPAFIRDNSVPSHFACELSLATGGTACDIRYHGGNTVGATTPMTWATSDYFHGLILAELL